MGKSSVPAPIWFQMRSAVEMLHSTSPAYFVKLLLDCLKHGDAFCIWRDKHQIGSCELEKREAKGNISGYHRKQSTEKTVHFINARTWETTQRKGNYNTSSPAHHLHVILVCHLQDAYVSLQDFFTRIFFGGDKPWGHCYTLTLVIDQHVLLILRVPWRTCKHRICNPRVKNKNLETCASRKQSDENGRNAPLWHLDWLKSRLQQVQTSLLAKMSSAVFPAQSAACFCMWRWWDWEGENDEPGHCVAGER